VHKQGARLDTRDLAGATAEFGLYLDRLLGLLGRWGLLLAHVDAGNKAVVERLGEPVDVTPERQSGEGQA
jgi:hypothetical protein